MTFVDMKMNVVLFSEKNNIFNLIFMASLPFNKIMRMVECINIWRKKDYEEIDEKKGNIIARVTQKK